LIAVDTSVVVAAFASWHEGHRAATAALAREPVIPAHVLVESYSVLTRLPSPHTALSTVVTAFLEARFRRPPLTLPPRLWLQLLLKAAREQVTGGAVYDAFVAATALHHGAVLLTRDRRAVRVYEKVGVAYELVF